ncbi:MAG: methyl-accepting chemotaxis protein [Treponema sp.]|jgi:methyl-accepting chemotaxis protein|nr:methyl-accepting chemotaxis protein [Treponema sp.]
MKNPVSGKSGQKKRKTSLRRMFVVFASILFAIILFGGSVIFFISMQDIIQTSTGNELMQSIEIEKIKLEASVNGEIAIAMKMADSPLLIQHFLNPADSDLRRIAFAEIVGYEQAFRSKTVFWCSDIDREFYFAADNHYTVNPDDPDNYWYRMTLYETERFNFNINYNAEKQETMLWINAPVFNRGAAAGRVPIGLVGTGIDLTEFVDSIYRSRTGKDTLYLFNAAGEITGAQDPKLIADKITIDKELGDLGADIIAKAKGLGSDEIQYYKMSNGEFAVAAIPSLDWYITDIQPITIMDSLKNGMTVLFLAMLAVIAVIFIIFYVFITWMLKPIFFMEQTLSQISTDWDLTRRLELHRRDEIGTLCEYFNLTFEKMRELLVGIKGETISLSETGDELTSQMTRTRKDVDGINSNIQVMREQVLSQADKVNAAANSIEQIISGMNKLNDHITVQAESVAQSSSAIEEMLANVQSVTQTLVKNATNITSLAESSEAGRTDLQKVSTDIQEIAHESESLLQINSVMQTISSQTNLLAMNAAIEAAHAGESGKGFAVVADEIRKLAENSGKQSKTISAVLKKIKLMIDTITKSTGIVMDRFKEIEEDVQTVSNQESQIRNAMEEQGEGSRQILEAVTQLNSVTGLVRKASSEMTEESKAVLNQSGDLKQITGEVASSMDEMTQGADEISDAVNKVQEIGDKNKKNISTVSRDITRFKVE